VLFWEATRGLRLACMSSREQGFDGLKTVYPKTDPETFMPDRPPLPQRLSPFARFVGLKPHREKGTSQCLLKLNDKLLNVNGTVHGGVISTLADVSMGWEVFEHLSERESITTIEMNINYFAAVSSGTLVAEANLLHRSRKLAVLESRITCGNLLVAKATGTFYVVRATESMPEQPGH
jgi:uncharacterized protein (TIGR00369 family)